MINVDLPYVQRIGNKLRVSSMPYLYSIAEGEIDGHYALHKFGSNLDVDTAEETVWSEGGLYAYLSLATTMTVSSANANDTILGTGARRVQINGLDSEYKQITETVRLNGVTGVSTINSFFRVYRMVVVDAGSGGKNAGIVYIGTGAIGAGKPAVVYGSVETGTNQSKMAIWTVPANHNLYITYISATDAAGVKGYIRLYVRKPGSVFQLKFELGLVGGTLSRAYQIPYKVAGRSDIELRAEGINVNCKISAAFDGWYENE